MSTILLRANDKKLLNSGRVIVYSCQADANVSGPEDVGQLVRAGMLLKVVKGVGSSISSVVLLTVSGEGKSRKYEMIEIVSSLVVAVLSQQVKAKMDVREVLDENETNSRGKKTKFATEDAGSKFDALGLPSSGVPLLTAAVQSFIGSDKLGKLDPDTTFAIQEYGTRFRELGNSTKMQCLQCPAFLEHLQLHSRRATLEDALSGVKFNASSESLELLPEYKQRIEVLQKLAFLDEHLVLLPKGQIASCISDNELLITEIVFENLLGGLSDEAIPAILSCFIFDSKNFNEPSTEHFSDIPELVEVSWTCL